MPKPMTIHGTVAEGFEPVARAFEQNFRRRGEVGASVCMHHRGERVVDLWAGLANRDTGAPWEPHTLVTVFSVTKGLVALCMLMQHARGHVDYDGPVADYWPEFAANGKGEITVRQLMNHRSGLIGVRQELTLDELEAWDPVAAKLADESPFWEPGTKQGYHGVSYGLYVRELFQRVAGETIGTFLRREVCGPLDADAHIGLAPEHQERVGRLIKPRFRQRLKALPGVITKGTPEGRVARALLDKASGTFTAFANPSALGFKSGDNFNTPRVHRMELPWCNGLASARGLATIYSVLSLGGSQDGVKLVPAELLEAVHPRQSWSERDGVLHKPLGWSQGFLKEEGHMFSPNPEAFGHAGMGGALGWADPVAELSIGYVMNQMDGHIRSPRALALCHAVYEAIG